MVTWAAVWLVSRQGGQPSGQGEQRARRPQAALRRGAFKCAGRPGARNLAPSCP